MAASTEHSHIIITPGPGDMPVEPDKGPATPPGNPADPANPLSPVQPVHPAV